MVQAVVAQVLLAMVQMLQEQVAVMVVLVAVAVAVVLLQVG
jgi:hypothetical protein